VARWSQANSQTLFPLMEIHFSTRYCGTLIGMPPGELGSRYRYR
jgi:hypothetical protein